MDNKQEIGKHFIYHLFFWMIAGTVWYYLRYQDYSTTSQAVWVTIIKTTDLAVMVYLVNYLLIPRLLYKRKYGWFFLSFISMIAISSLYKMYVISQVTSTPFMVSWEGNIKGGIYDNMIPHFFLVLAGMTFQLLFDYTRIQKRLTEVAKEKAEAELNFLKSQINPHFLFNSLNSVYFLIDKQNTAARDALHKFSEMLRYQLYEMKDQKIPIEKEINYLQDYIDLQRLRMEENCSVEFCVQENLKSFFIEPLLLIPLVENSFKHLSHFNNGKENAIRIDMSRKNGELDFYVGNSTEGKQVHRLKSDGGIGLNNVKRRLELLYPNRHKLHIIEQNDWFDVRLQIKIE